MRLQWTPVIAARLGWELEEGQRWLNAGFAARSMEACRSDLLLKMSCDMRRRRQEVLQREVRVQRREVEGQEGIASVRLLIARTFADLLLQDHEVNQALGVSLQVNCTAMAS